jgi:cell wall-associated NlpC family hydrolase
MSSDRLDPRRHAYREDLAADSLRGKVMAERFVSGELQRVARATAALRRAPDPALGFDTELVYGETVQVYDTANGWAWCQAIRDGYVGYTPYDALALDVPAATHRVSAIGTFLHGQPDIKSPPLMHLSINAPLAVTETGDRFYRLATGGYVIARHVSPLGKVARDFVDIAERLIGVPYLWGGRTRVGLDCSALVQVAMQAAGLACPRDSDMQEAELGANLLVPDELSGLRRGDLVFWKGHVGVMTDGVMLLHANAHHMAVVAEPLSTARQRIAKAGREISSIKRPAAISADPIGRSA